MNPSDFKNFPYSSVFQNTKHEIVARNIMTILKRTGNEFRSIEWQEYKDERIKDGQPDNYRLSSEKIYFERVSGYLVSEKKARTFSDNWNI